MISVGTLSILWDIDSTGLGNKFSVEKLTSYLHRQCVFEVRALYWSSLKVFVDLTLKMADFFQKLAKNIVVDSTVSDVCKSWS